MPLYTYKCHCGQMAECFNRIDDRHNGPECECGAQMDLWITPTMLQPVLGGGDFPGYECPITDEFVTSRKRRRDIMKEHNLVEAGDRKPFKDRVNLDNSQT